MNDEACCVVAVSCVLCALNDDELLSLEQHRPHPTASVSYRKITVN